MSVRHCRYTGADGIQLGFKLGIQLELESLVPRKQRLALDSQKHRSEATCHPNIRSLTEGAVDGV